MDCRGIIEKGRETLGEYNIVVLRKVRGKGSKPRIGYHRGKKEKGKMGSLF